MKQHRFMRGFTITETIVVTSIFAVLSLALMQTIVTLYRTNAYTLEQAYEINHARRGVERTVRDVREMTYGDDGSYPLVEMASGTIGFYSDIDRDNSVEYVRYTLEGTTLYKYVYNATGTMPTYDLDVPDETHTISEYVRNDEQATSTFRYYIQGGSLATATSTVMDVRYIDVTAIINIDPNRNPGEFMLRSSAAPRNIKTSF